MTLKSPESLEMVAQFHHLFGHPVVESPAIPSEERGKLRISLLAEELKELEQAIQDKDLVEIADALSDLQYVLSGAVLEFGLGSRFKELFEEVQRSNMSKACKTQEEAEKTVAHYQAKGTECHYEEKDGLFLVYRTADRKTLKSIAYSPANLADIVNR